MYSFAVGRRPCPWPAGDQLPYRVDRGDDRVPTSFGVVYWLVSACVGVGGLVCLGALVVVGRLQLCWLGVMACMAFSVLWCSQGRSAERGFVVGVGVVRGARCLACWDRYGECLCREVLVASMAQAAPSAVRRLGLCQRSGVVLLHSIALSSAAASAVALASVAVKAGIGWGASPWWGVLLFPAP
jgi:hypothetical protein